MVWGICRQYVLQHRYFKRLERNLASIAPIEGFACIKEYPPHKSINASTHDKVDSRRLVKRIPNARHLAEYTMIDPKELLKLVDDQRDRSLGGLLHDPLEESGK